MLTSYFFICILWVLPLKTDIGKLLTDQLVFVLTEPKNMLIPYTVFNFELFSWFIFLAECKILNFADVGMCKNWNCKRKFVLLLLLENSKVLAKEIIFCQGVSAFAKSSKIACTTASTFVHLCSTLYYDWLYCSGPPLAALWILSCRWYSSLNSHRY